MCSPGETAMPAAREAPKKVAYQVPRLASYQVINMILKEAKDFYLAPSNEIELRLIKKCLDDVDKPTASAGMEIFSVYAVLGSIEQAAIRGKANPKMVHDALSKTATYMNENKLDNGEIGQAIFEFINDGVGTVSKHFPTLSL